MIAEPTVCPPRRVTAGLFLLMLMVSYANAQSTGLDFPGSAAVSTTMRFKFDNPQNDGLPIYGPGGTGVTYIWRAYPRQQAGYYTTFFWGNDGAFWWDSGSPNTYYGAHPYPQPPPSGITHRWEVATDGGDFLSAENVVYDRWYTQALVAWSDGSGKHTLFYWDLPDQTRVISVDSSTSYGNTLPPNPALTWGDAPWAPGNEVWNGILRGIQIYSTKLSLADIQSEVTSPLSTPAGANNIWYLNLNPTPSDISDKSGNGHHPSWVGNERPALYSSGGDSSPPIADAGRDQVVVDRDGSGAELITLDGSNSTDSDGQIVVYEWREDANAIAQGPMPGVELPVGEHTITLTVTDDQNATDTDTVQVKVEEPPILLTILPTTTLPGLGPAAINVSDNNGRGRVEIVDIETAEELSAFNVTAGLLPMAIGLPPDLNNDGSADLAIVVLDESDMEPKVELHDPLTGARFRNINYNKEHAPVDLDISKDSSGDLLPYGAMLVKRISDGRPRILIRNLETKAKVNNVSLPAIFDVHGLVMAPDFSGDGDSDALVLASRLSDGKGFVLVWDTGGAGKIVNVPLPKNHTPIDLAYLIGPGGVAAVAVLTLRTTDGRGRVFVYDALIAAKLWAAALGTGQTPVALRSFQTAGGGARVAVLVERRSDMRPIARIYNSNTGTVVDNVAYEAGQVPLALLITPDTSLDDNANPELSVLVDRDSDRQLRVRDSVTKTLLQTISIP